MPGHWQGPLIPSLVWNGIKSEETYVEASECLILVEILKSLECVEITNGLNIGYRF